jgi:hypothetical protein
MSIETGLSLEQRDHIDAHLFLDTEIHQMATDKV